MKVFATASSLSSAVLTANQLVCTKDSYTVYRIADSSTDPSAITTANGKKAVPVSGAKKSIAAIEAITGQQPGDTVYLSLDGRSGDFTWTLGDFSAEVAADTLQGAYIKATAIAATVGAWVRKMSAPLRSSMFFSGVTTGDHVGIQSLMDLTSLYIDGIDEFIIDCRVSFGGAITIPSDFTLTFTEDGIIIPESDVTKGIDNQNTAPAVTYALAASAAIGDNLIDVGANVSNFSVGDYIFINDTALITTSPNTNNLTQAQTATVREISGNTLILDCSIEYDFSSATAFVGVVTGPKNITLNGFRYGEIGGQVGGVGADFRYVSGLKINGFKCYNSRTTADADPAYNRLNVNALTIRCCSDVEINDVEASVIGWYGISIDGACRNVTVKNLNGAYMRHGVSINWNGPGEPINVLVEGLKTNNTQYGGMDTHDVGRDITFRKVRCYNAIEDGGQVRTSNVLVDDYVGAECGKNGLLVYLTPGGDGTRLNNVKLKNITTKNNGKRGVTSVLPVDIDGLVCTGNGSTYSTTDNGGVSLNGGSIRNAKIEGNNGPAITYRDGASDTAYKKPLLIENVSAPYDAVKQTKFLYSQDTYQDASVRLRDVEAIGYSTANLFSRAGSSYVADIDDSGCRWSNEQTRGVVTLSSGSATVTNANARAVTSLTARNWFSRINLQRVSAGASPGYLTISIIDATSFTITSSDGADNGSIAWSFV